MMGSMVEVPPDDGGSINNLSLNAAWNGTAANATNNSNILFIAVEYVSKEHDFKLESEPSLSPQQRYTEFDQHVSPLDPNMSSVARYSPVYTSEPSAYVNPVVVTQLVADPTGTPSVEMPPTSTVGDSMANHELQHVSNQYLQMVEEGNGNVSGDGVNEMRMVRDVEQGVDILITDQSTGISYLVERCLANDSQLLDPDSLLGSDLLSLDESTQLSEIIIGEQNMHDQEDDDAAKTEMKGGERRSQRQISNCVPETEEELLSCVQQICDRPILSRARASLPESHLVIIKNQLGGNSVFAKKFIPKRTQFGPIEGVLVPDDGIKQEDDRVVLTIESSGQFQKLDVSDENSSNWMGFVQLAQCHSEQNLVLTQQDNYLYYTTIKHIHPKQELLVGYGINYAQRRNLHILEPLIEEEDLWPCYECSEQFLSSVELQKHLDQHDLDSQTPNSANKKRKRKNPTPQSVRNEALQCTVCLEIFTSQKFSTLRQHLLEHGLDPMEQLQNRFIIAKSYNCDECDAIYVKEDELNCHMEKHQQSDSVAVSYEPKETERQKAEYKCPVCHKSFASGERVHKHMLVHGAEELKPLKCDKCNKRFLNNSALTCHLKTHLVGRKVFECPICKESFHHVLQLKLHVPKHSTNGRYTCPHCHKLFEKYSIIRKHIRAFHCERKHRCTDCEKLFPTLDKLRTHLVKHSDHREFLCADCGKQFKRKDKLREHCKRMHSEERENAIPRDKTEVLTPTKKFTPKVHPSDYQRFIYKCHTCLLGFKRRGMLVNHLAKRHPDISPDSVPELNLPILKATKDYYCNYCDKVYKSSSKRKAHILKIHPGASLPLSNRRLDSTKSDLPNPTFSQTVGSVTTRPQACQWCHKQYASKAKLLQHQRKKHNEMLHDKKDDLKSSEEDLLTQQDSHYYQLVMDDSHFGQQDIAGDSRLYKLLTTGNNLVPPR